jgi:hypothetical protein
MSDFNHVYEKREAVKKAASDLVTALTDLERAVDTNEYTTHYRHTINDLRFKAKAFLLDIEERVE